MAKRKPDIGSIKNTTANMPMLSPEEKQQYEQNAHPAAISLAETALRKGASVEPYSPCGLDVVLAALFGEETYKDFLKR